MKISFALRFGCLLATALMLSGCGPSLPVDPGQLRLPSARLMAPPPRLPEPPDGDGNPATRAEHYAAERAAHAVCVAQVEGLQGYARAVSQLRTKSGE